MGSTGSDTETLIEQLLSEARAVSTRAPYGRPLFVDLMREAAAALAAEKERADEEAKLVDGLSQTNHALVAQVAALREALERIVNEHQHGSISLRQIAREALDAER